MSAVMTMFIDKNWQNQDIIEDNKENWRRPFLLHAYTPEDDPGLGA